MASLDLAGIITRVCSDLAYRFAPLYHTHSNYAPVSHAHGTISSVGDITATAPTIASGDKLIINDESASKVTNGPSFGSSTTTFLANNGTWQTPAGTYSLPAASTSTLGGVKVDGTTITIADGVISSSGGGGGGDAYVIGMTLSGTTVSNVTYPTGESATTIATAVMDDPSTRVVFSIDVGADDGVMNCTPCSIQASAYPAYGDMATSISAVIPMWYEAGGDRETYLLRLTLLSGSWYAATRVTI